jgi:hypothetical protein
MIEALAGSTTIIGPKAPSWEGSLSPKNLSARTLADVCFGKTTHFRDGHGRREADLTIECGDGSVLAMDLSLGQTVTRNHLKHRVWLGSQLGDDLIDSVALYSGRHVDHCEGVVLCPWPSSGTREARWRDREPSCR